MCGIVGYIGPKNPFPVLIKGLQKLEYRGYDSAGVASIDSGKFDIYRSEGKLSKLRSVLENRAKLNGDSSCSPASAARIGLGHTRWATHGRPSETNAHPHVAGDICLVHNGIIENYTELRRELQAKGCVFSSETDTEIAAHLINDILPGAKNLLDAVRKAITRLSGSYALVVISSKEPDTLVVAKNATPVVIGLADGENFIASDIPAILDHTRTVIVLEDGELAQIKQGSVYIERDGKEVSREPINITWDPITAEKGGYRHFMLKEIYEQPQVIHETFRGRIDLEHHRVAFDEFNLTDGELRNIKRVVMCACGTAWHAALVTKFYIEKFAKIPVEVDYASELRYRSPVINGETLFIVVSQSGETADTLGALMLALELGAKTVAITNVLGSTIARKAKNVIFTHAGPEISVASTKAFVTQVTVGMLLALHLGRVRGTVSEDELSARANDLLRLPHLLSDALGFDKQVERIARKYGRSEHFLFLGRGILYPIALEGALKLKEISYVHAEGYPAGEMKHGPIALINEELPVVVVIGHDDHNYEKAMSNMQEVESRGGRIIAVTDVESPQLRELAWETVAVGEIPQSLLPLVLTLPLQLLAYHVAVYRGTDVDQPRNLAKSVTVE
jgi:glutamine---fructose-6-phosphate transaminase (isomerizing)